MPPTTHRDGLLRVGSLPCAPTYNRGVVQHVVSDRFGLAQPHECSSKAATCHANSTVQAASDIESVPRTLLLYDTRCKGYRCVLGTRLHRPRRANLERVPTDLIILILCLRRRYAVTAVVIAATLSSIPVSNLREVCA